MQLLCFWAGQPCKGPSAQSPHHAQQAQQAQRAACTARTFMMGVEMFLAALMISLMRGTPSVTFMDATPAKWNVFSVI